MGNQEVKVPPQNVEAFSRWELKKFWILYILAQCARFDYFNRFVVFYIRLVRVVVTGTEFLL